MLDALYIPDRRLILHALQGDYDSAPATPGTGTPRNEKVIRLSATVEEVEKEPEKESEKGPSKDSSCILQKHREGAVAETSEPSEVEHAAAPQNYIDIRAHAEVCVIADKYLLPDLKGFAAKRFADNLRCMHIGSYFQSLLIMCVTTLERV